MRDPKKEGGIFFKAGDMGIWSPAGRIGNGGKNRVPEEGRGAGTPSLSAGRKEPEVFAVRAGSWDVCCSVVPRNTEVLTGCHEDGGR